MTPGDYIRGARDIAGIDRADVAALLAMLGILSADAAALLIADVEDDRVVAGTMALMALRIAFDFRPATYRALAAQAASSPPAEGPHDHA